MLRFILLFFYLEKFNTVLRGLTTCTYPISLIELDLVNSRFILFCVNGHITKN